LRPVERTRDELPVKRVLVVIAPFADRAQARDEIELSRRLAGA
jgi:hypothetical protein